MPQIPTPRDVLTPDALAMLQVIAAQGSFAAAARHLGQVPSALTYRVRQMEDALDVLLFDRSARQARLTEAGAELLREGARLLVDIDAVANRVKRVATGWEPQLTIAIDGALTRTPLMELCEAFFALSPPTRIKIREEVLSGTLSALTSGQADLAIGVILEPGTNTGLRSLPLGPLRFVYAVAPHHPLADVPEPLEDELVRQHRAVAVADSVQRGAGLTVNLLGGQDVFTVATMAAKLEAMLRGIGGGFLPEYLVQPYASTGRLVTKRINRTERIGNPSYAWMDTPNMTQGKALTWWLQQLSSAKTQAALLGQHGM
jgi:DNA-binding transcriptional LysR family regulator